MFTGLVETVGRIARIDAHGRDRRLRIEPGEELMRDLRTGDSIAVAGACLTAVDPDSTGFHADVSAETLAHTSLGERGVGDRVNLERALLPTTRLGGHMVSGHVDGVGEIVGREADGQSWRFRIRVPDTLARYIAPKGSICVDGISLTVNEVDGAVFGVNIVPHTMTMTTLADTAQGDPVNIEVDVIARYLERLLSGADDAPAGVTRDTLVRTGFVPAEGGGSGD
jgi:riboflavin synthase